MSDLLLEGDELAVDLGQCQVERRERIGGSLLRVHVRSAAAVEVDEDAALEHVQITLLALLQEFDLGVDHLAEVVDQALQLALRHVAHLLPHTVGTVVQDDLHSPSIRRPRRPGRGVTSAPACTPEAEETER